MQNKGAIKFLAIMLAIACLYQLSFTFVTRSVESKARTLANGDAAREVAYLDSLKSVPVYNLGFIKYTYGECKEKEINLGLDLKGGMNVTLQISVRDVLVALSNDSKDQDFNTALTKADQKQQNSRADYITLFSESYKEVAPSGRLSDIFSTYDLKDIISPDATNEKVIEVLREQSESAIANSYNVLRSRIDRFGVVQPNVQRLENSGRILVELPGVKEPERVRKLLQGTASLEFWETINNTEMLPILQNIDKRLADLAVNGKVGEEDANAETNVDANAESAATEAVVDTTANSADTTATDEAKPEGDLVSDIINQDSVKRSADASKTSPLFSVMAPMFNPQTMQAINTPVIGYAHASDTSKVNALLNMPQIKPMLPRGVVLMWGVKAMDKAGTTFELYAINANTKDGKAKLDGGAVTHASPKYNEYGSGANVSMVMNSAGSKTWARLTKENIGKHIAIVLDGYVYSAPTVQGEISGGQSQITGNFTYQEATDLSNVLQSGKLPASAHIIQEAVVGPSLGQESIDAGMMSFVIAFIFVLVYMILYYNTAGMVACVALVSNLFFLFGVLASFGAVLTLPGIAGVVLTMGMAVDANVIIYERIKEELKAGKGLSMSIADGFKQAYSAIIDGNVTTLLTGIVLFIFGTGPVQGFATTLVLGIITSLFTSIFITRVIFTSLVESGKNVSFSNRFTRDVLNNVKFDFVAKRKVSYVISGALILVSIVSLFVNGLSYGVDFSGGRSYVIRFDKEISADQVRDALSSNENFKSGLEVKQFGDATQMRIVTQYRHSDEGENVTNEINGMLYTQLNPLYAETLTIEEFTTNINQYGILSSDTVGPTVAHDITINSFIAVLFSLLSIFIYIVIRFKKWQWAMGGVISLFHDAFVTIGMFSLLRFVLPFELEINQAFIAAILTIIGYSINDTVVIFDRIREYIGLYPKRPIGQNINGAISSTLVRTLNTAGTTLVVLLAMFIFGGEVIRGFIFALTFGVFIGTYSSIFIATPVAYDFMPEAIRKK